jgi:magnesium chelatase subunit I
MSEEQIHPEESPAAENANLPGSLKELIDRVSGRHLGTSYLEGESSGIILEAQPFPFLALVGQDEMKLALLLNLINPAIGGVLLIGPRGTGKTTAVRSLTELLPEVPRSLCQYGCLPEDIERGGIDAVCPECAKKYGEGEPLAKYDKVRLIEMPLNSHLEDVVGGLNESAAQSGQFRVRRGILALADRNLLYIDEVNLLPDVITDAILDAAAQGQYTVRRGPLTASYYARFVLIGSMNPEEGNLRPQLLDRFGLRVLVDGLTEADERLEAYRRSNAYKHNPHHLVDEFADSTTFAQEEIQAARDTLSNVTLPDAVAQYGLQLVKEMGIASLRAEIALFEAARAYAAAEARSEVTSNDLRQVAPMTLRLRRSGFIEKYFSEQRSEEGEITSLLDKYLPSDEE